MVRCTWNSVSPQTKIVSLFFQQEANIFFNRGSSSFGASFITTGVAAVNRFRVLLDIFDQVFDQFCNVQYVNSASYRAQ